MESPAESNLVRAFTQLARSANLSGVPGIVTLTAQLVNGWAILLDRSGTVAAASGASRIHISDAIAVAEGRSRDARISGLQRFPVGPPSSPSAFLVVSSKGRTVSHVSAVADHACALLSLIADPLRSPRLESIAQADAVELLCGSDAAAAERTAHRWGLTGERFSVVAVGAATRSLVLEPVVAGWLRDLAVVAPMATDQDGLVLVVPQRHVEALESIIVAAAADRRVPFHCGIGRLLALGSLSASRSQARVALEVAIADRRPVQRFDALATIDLVLRTMPRDTADALRAPLAALDGYPEETRAELLRSVRVFLAFNGAWEASAAQLRVHRHTLRARISRFEELTGLSVGNSDDRIALVLALRTEAASG